MDAVFVCVPTPSKPDGASDISNVCEAAEKLKGTTGVIALRSTVPPGTTEYIEETFDIPNIVHSPEFLTERYAEQEASNPKWMVIGSIKGNTHSVASARLLNLFYNNRFPNIQICMMSSRESELMKLACNSFFATKISFFNELKLLCEKMDTDYSKILSGMLCDQRISGSHTRVPGHDRQKGFGGNCLPKDLCSLISVAGDLDIKTNTMIGAWETNKFVRPNIV
jgi:UDPglucose 6-dehydrogenase